MPIERSRTSGCSILLNQPTKRVVSRLGMRLVSRKLRSSCSDSLAMRDRTVMQRHTRSDSVGRHGYVLYDMRPVWARRRGLGAALAKLKIAPAAVEGQAPVAGRPFAHVAPVGFADPVLRVRRSAILPCRQRAGRGCRAPARRFHTAGAALSGALRQDAPADGRGQGRPLRPAVHVHLSRAVPVQPGRARALERRLVLAVVGRRYADRSRRQYLLRPDGLLRRQLFGYDFYKACMEKGAERVRDLGPVLGAYHPRARLQRRRAEADLRPRRGVVPHVGHRGGHAGGAAWPAITHAARIWCGSAAPITVGGATCSRASAIRCRRARPTR